MASMCINTSVDFKQTLEPRASRSLTDMPSSLESRTSVLSSLFRVFRLPTRGGGKSIRELVSSNTAWPLVLVRSKHIDGPLADMTRPLPRPPIEWICGTLTLGNRRTFGGFFSTKAQTLGPGQFRALARAHVFVFQYKCPVDGQPGDPNLRLLNHRSGILIGKRALESNVRGHYTGHNTFEFMASVSPLKEVHKVCRLQVDGWSTLEWGTDC